MAAPNLNLVHYSRSLKLEHRWYGHPAAFAAAAELLSSQSMQAESRLVFPTVSRLISPSPLPPTR